MFGRIRVRQGDETAVAHERADAGDGGNSGHHQQPQQKEEGILLRTVRPGDAANYPCQGDTVRVHYDAFLKDTGEKFDSSRDRRQEFRWRVGEQQSQVIEGLDLAIPRMSVGQVAEITIPSELAYGVQGYPPLIPPKSDLVFVVELIGLL